MKVLVLTRYGSLGASSRMRILQYNQRLTEANIQLTIKPLFSNSYITDLQNNKKNIAKIFLAYLKRFYLMSSCKSFDLIWIEKECFPWLPFWLENFFLPPDIPFALDYDDAVFHQYDQHKNWLIRLMLKYKHPMLIQRSALTIVGNDYLADYARSYKTDYVYILPTAIDLERYSWPIIESLEENRENLVYGWIGQQSTAYNLLPLEPLFNHFSRKESIVFKAIGIDANAIGLSMDSLQWTEDSEVESLQNFDVGIMPLEDRPFERGKCSYKLIQYMACGIPVIASCVGMNAKIVSNGVNGYLANSLEDWHVAFTSLASNKKTRRAMGLAGRVLVENEYCTQVIAPRLIELLHTAVSNK